MHQHLRIALHRLIALSSIYSAQRYLTKIGERVDLPDRSKSPRQLEDESVRPRASLSCIRLGAA